MKLQIIFQELVLTGNMLFMCTSSVQKLPNLIGVHRATWEFWTARIIDKGIAKEDN